MLLCVFSRKKDSAARQRKKLPAPQGLIRRSCFGTFPLKTTYTRQFWHTSHRDPGRKIGLKICGDMRSFETISDFFDRLFHESLRAGDKIKILTGCYCFQSLRGTSLSRVFGTAE